MTARLCLGQLAQLPAGLRPVPSPGDVSVGVVHLGIGAFHRAHQAVYTQKAMGADGTSGWGVCGVTQRSRSVVELLAPQDCLYSVLVPGDDASPVTVVGSVREVLFAQDGPEEVVDRLARPATKVISLTVSEKGYRFNPATRRLSTDDPDLVADAQGRPPVTVIGQLVAGLQARRRQGGPPVTVLCCDNMTSNGTTLDQLVHDYCNLVAPAEADALVSWMETHVTFPNTMVDRIVPATTDQDLATAAALLGMEDRAVVVTEQFSQWVVEDRFAGPRPAWDKVGVELVRDVAPYEEVKLRLLNGSHSALAYLGALAGYDLVSQAVGDQALAAYVRALMDTDVTPTLAPPSGFDLEGYKDALMARFANPALRHRTQQIAMDGSQKLPYRLLNPVRERLAVGAEPHHASLAVAAWMRYVSVARADDGRQLEVKDPLLGQLRAALAGRSAPSEVADALLGVRAVFPADVAEHPVFRRLVVEALGVLSEHGAVGALAAYGPA